MKHINYYNHTFLESELMGIVKVHIANFVKADLKMDMCVKVN